MSRTREYRTVKEKLAWGDGPWVEEPDKVQWQDGASGLPCLAVRNRHGAWCGYVGVAEEHPLFGRDLTEFADLDVHGGVTFAATCQEGPEETSICHVPEPGEPDHVWWLGFDCGHFHDLSPAYEYRNPTDLRVVGIYRTLDYVRAECADLARQLHAWDKS